MLEKNDPRITAYVLDELQGAERAEIEAAIAASPELQREVESIRRATALLSEHLPGAPCPELTEQQRQAIQQESVSSEMPAVQPTAPYAGHLRRIAVASVAIAASLLIAVLLFSEHLVFPLARNESPTLTVSPSTDEADFEAMEELSVDYPDVDAVTVEEAPSTQAMLSSAAAPFDSYGEGAPRSDPMPEPSGYGGSQPSRHGYDDPSEFAPAETAEPFGVAAPEPMDTSSHGPGGAEPADDFAHDGDNQAGDNGPRVADPSGADEEWADDESATEAPMEEDDTDPAGGEESHTSPTPAGNRSRPHPDGESGQAGSESGDGSGGEGQGQGLGERPGEDGRQGQAGDSSDDAATSDISGESGDSDSSSGEQGGQKSGAGKKPRKPQAATWRRSKATPNASRLMVGDRDDLPLEGMQVNVTVDGFRARVLLDLYYYNNRAQQLEGRFKLRLPNEASLYYFAFGQTSFQYRPMVDSLASEGFLTPELVRASGTGPAEILKARSETWRDVKEARLVPRAKAAHAYSEVVRRRVDPALVEWSGPGVFNASVFPLMPNKLHRIVVGYDVNLEQDGEDLLYQLDLPEELSQCSVDLDVSALPGASAEVTPAARPFVSGGRAFYHFDDPASGSIGVRFHSPGVLMLTGSDEAAGEFFATRVTPQLPADESQAGASHAVFLVDTSLSSNPDKYNVWLAMLESILDKNRDEMKQFAVLFFNIESHWWRGKFVKNTPDNVNAMLNDASSLALEGATDMRQALAEAIAPDWIDSEEKQPVYDLFLLSDGAATWGETEVRGIARVLQAGSGSLFAYKTGLTGTAIGHLEHLARETGGAVFSVATERDVATAATAHRTRPWRLLDLAIDGAEDVLIAGRPNFLYPGQSLTVVGRGTPGAELFLRVGRGQEKQRVQIPVDRMIESELSARLYGQVAVGQLEDLGDSIEDVSVAFARHFRVTGRTCSLLMLESEADYQRYNIRPEDDLFVVKSSPADDLILRMYDELAQTIDDPKQALKVWLDRMENMPGVQFQMPTALRLVVDRLPRKAFEVETPRLVCEKRELQGLPKQFFKQLEAEQLDYDVVSGEATRRFQQFGAADALKAVSNLVEKNPGDVVLAQDVAFSAIEWGLAGQAYPLLRRVADARPYQPHVYQALASCLAELGCADLAIVYYEVAVNGRWHERYRDFREIAEVEYLHLLNRIEAGELSTNAPQYVSARRQALADEATLDDADLVVTMMWNTDRTDVDLHVLEPTGEECYYKNRSTRAGGQITRDVTEGFGPEMYRVVKARPGAYRIMANYYGSDTNRTQVRTKVYVTVFEMFGKKQERLTRHTVTLNRGKEKRDIATVSIE